MRASDDNDYVDHPRRVTVERGSIGHVKREQTQFYLILTSPMIGAEHSNRIDTLTERRGAGRELKTERGNPLLPNP